MFTMRNVCVLASVFCLLGAARTSLAEECTFQPTSGNWDSAGNWSCSKVPDSGDTVIIASGKTCTVAGGGSDQACQSFDLDGTLVIDAGRTLTVSAASTNDGSLDIDGTLSMSGVLTTGSGGSVALAGTLSTSANLVLDGTIDVTGSLSLSSSLTISGDGLIILQQDTGVFTGQITGAGTLTLSDDGGGDPLRVIGTGEIDNDVVNNALVQAGTSGGGSFDGDLELRGDVSGSGTFEADDGMQLVLLGGATGSATWHTTSSSSANQITLTVAACVSGPVNIERGRFQLEADFCTTGDLDLGDSGSANAGEVAVIAGATAQFGVSACSTCP